MAAAPEGQAAEGFGDRWRIDDLARVAGTTVRNVRAYQDRGLLPPPTRVGRIGWYSDAHLARLRLIGEMLSRGYSLANIGELIDGWERGRDLTDVLGLEAALIAPWGEDRSAVYTREELEVLFPTMGPDHLDSALGMGLVSRDGERFRVADPHLVQGAILLIDAGVPVDVVMGLGGAIASATDEIARRYVEMISDHVIADAPDPLPAEKVRELSALVRGLRPLAKEVVGAGLAAALERRIGAELGRHLSRSADLGDKAAS
jgi:DNA-binding transcriptional MerR regulator